VLEYISIKIFSGWISHPQPPLKRGEELLLKIKTP
jgi:hypothetical protein